MKVFVKVRPNAKQNSLEKIEENEFRACVKAPPYEGRANLEVIKLLSEYFDIPKSMVIIIRGSKGKDKVFEVDAN